MKLMRTGIVLTCVLGMTAVHACGGGGSSGVPATGGSVCGIECSGTAECDTPVGQQSATLSVAGNTCVLTLQDGRATLNCNGTGSAVSSDGTVSGTWTGSGTAISGDFEGAWSCTITPATTPDAGTSDTGTSDTGASNTCGLECSGTAVCSTPIGEQSGPVASTGEACIFTGQDGVATLNCDGTGSATSSEGSVSGTWTGSGTSVTGDFGGAWSCTITPAATTEPDAGTSVPDSGSGESLCTDTCEDAADGWCDDGAPDAETSICEYGTDCTDCGPREPMM